MDRNAFAAWVAVRFPLPEDALSAFFEGAVAAAAEVGAKLDRAPKLDGRRVYLSNLDGRRDQRQYVRASVQTMDDGSRWASLSFGTFTGGGRTLFWSPRNDAWHLFRAEVDGGTHVEIDIERAEAAHITYAERAAAAAAQAEAAARANAELERERHAAAAEAAAAAWAAAVPTDGTHSHPYLTKKQLRGDGLRVATGDMRARLYSVNDGRWHDRATVVRAGELLVPMLTAAGELVNLERIDVAGNKRGLTGGQRIGAFYVIARTSADARRAVCEGWATAAAWNAATGDATAVAFTAGNLPAVAAAFDAGFVAADNDAKSAGERSAQATGRPWAMPANVGEDWFDVYQRDGAEPLRKAARDALASASVPIFAEPSKLAAPELKGRSATWFNKLAKISDDAEHAAALAWAIASRLSARIPCADSVAALIGRIANVLQPGAMHPRTLAAIRDGIERRIDWRKRRALSALRMSPEALKRHRVEFVDELPELRPEDYRGVIIIAAPLGSGKTQRIGAPFAEWAKREGAGFLAVAHRVSLIEELSRRLGVDNYQRVTAEAAPFIGSMATCVNSLTSEAHAGIIGRSQFVFIDEIAQVLRAIASETTVAGKRSRGDMLNALRRLVAEAECVIVADAGMDDRVLRFVQSCRPGERARVIIVPARDEGLRATFGVGADALASTYGEALAMLAEGQRVWIATGEASRAREAAALLEGRGHRVLLLTGDNRENAEPARFWRDPEGVAREYDVVVASPVVSSGLSIEHRGTDGGTAPHFDHCFWLGSGARITPADALQQLRRVRYVKNFTISILPNHAHDQDDAAAILAGMEDSADIAGVADFAPKDVDALVAEIDAADARARADFAGGLWWSMEAAGFTVSAAQDGDGEDGEDDDAPDSSGAGPAAMTAELRLLRAQLREARIASILGARVIELREALSLRDRPNRSEADALALDRFFIADALGIECAAVDRQAIEAHDQGRGPRMWDRWSAAVLGLGDIRAENAELSRRRFPKARVAAYARLFDGFNLAPKETRFTDQDAREIVARVLRDRYMLAFLRLIPARYGRAAEPKPSERPMRELSDIFALLGLSLKRRRANKFAPMSVTAGESTRTNIKPSDTQTRQIVGTATWYEIDSSTWDRMAALAERRNAHKVHAREMREAGPVADALSRMGSSVRAAGDALGWGRRGLLVGAALAARHARDAARVAA